MTNTGKAERLAELKLQIKALEEEAKDLQSDLIGEGAADKIKTSLGTLSLTTRENWSCTDKQRVFREVGEGAYIAASSLPISGLKKAVGEFLVDSMINEGTFMLKSVSKYYTLRR